jgi:hypothetical protein
MKAEMRIGLIDYDEEEPGPLSSTTRIDLEVENDGIMMQMPDDRQDDSTYPRGVKIEVNSDGELCVLSYALDTEEPLRVRLPRDGGFITEDLGDENNDVVNETERLRRQVEALEALRPVWAQGHTNDGLAAQTFGNALSEIWRLLGVRDQTGAVAAIRDLQHKNGEC